ncbi:MAG: DNA repair protein RecO [Alistipes sp.]|nr:DNA repair protein RecO [Candidatus Minthomonas equi]
MIVLHTTRYGDTSLIIHGYTRDNGRESFLLRGVGKSSKKGDKRHSTALLHPLSILDAVTTENRLGKIGYIREFSSAARLDSIRSDISKSGIAQFLSEFLYKCLRESIPDAQMHDFIVRSILTLETLEKPFANFHILFLMRFAEISGFPPVHGFEKEFDPFDSAQKAVLAAISHLSTEEAMKLPLTGSMRSDLSEALIQYIGFHLGLHLEILSSRVLHAIFS